MPYRSKYSARWPKVEADLKAGLTVSQCAAKHHIAPVAIYQRRLRMQRQAMNAPAPAFDLLVGSKNTIISIPGSLTQAQKDRLNSVLPHLLT